MWAFYLAMLASIWALLVWLLTLPSLIKHLANKHDLADLLLYFIQFLFTPLTLLVVAVIFIITKLLKLVWALVEAVLAVALMILLIIVAPFVVLAEKLNLRSGWLFEQWMKVGDFVLDLIHKLFSKALNKFAALVVPDIRVKPPSPPPTDGETS